MLTTKRKHSEFYTKTGIQHNKLEQLHSHSEDLVYSEL